MGHPRRKGRLQATIWVGVSAMLRATPEAAITIAASAKARRAPNRSTTAPHGTAASMYTNGHAPRIAPISELPILKSARIALINGASDVIISPKQLFVRRRKGRANAFCVPP